MYRLIARTFVATLIASLAASAAAHAQPPLKVYISADMEGVAGAVTSEQLGPGGFEYERFRGFMTDEVLAAVEGAREAGATEIVISDSHGNGQNLLIERLPADVLVVRSWPRPLGMMEGIDSTFDAALFVGYHASSISPTGVRAHTMSSAHFAELALNGTPMSEAGLNAAIAGHFGVPVVLVTGDDVAVAETRALLGDVEGAAVKRAISFHAAESMTPEAARELIRERTRSALTRLGDFRPYQPGAPVRLDLALQSYRPAELLAYLPIVERTGARSIRYIGDDILAVSTFLRFLSEYSLDLDP